MAVATNPAATDTQATSIIDGRIAGVVLPTIDLAASREFYEQIFQAGEWVAGAQSLTFISGDQRIELVHRARPRVFGLVGAHIGFRISSSRLGPTADALRDLGREVHWWREDHPSERKPTAYVADPSGNLVQLVADDSAQPLIAHVTLTVHDLELAEKFYLAALGGRVEHYHSWRTDDILEAQAWATDGDPCAPWTRTSRYSRIRHESVARPTPQLYIGYGHTTLGLVVGTRHVQEPPEETLKGTPRLVFETERSVREIADAYPALKVTTGWHLANGRGVLFRREGKTLYFKDRSGNFLQLDCTA
jgi:catechol 2,3-dioxygenase-like lactoylglutathione lyase family enzyme